jgi:hypothetical protein
MTTISRAELRDSAAAKRGLTVLAWVIPEGYGIIKFDAEPMTGTG